MQDLILGILYAAVYNHYWSRHPNPQSMRQASAAMDMLMFVAFPDWKG